MGSPTTGSKGSNRLTGDSSEFGLIRFGAYLEPFAIVQSRAPPLFFISDPEKPQCGYTVHAPWPWKESSSRESGTVTRRAKHGALLVTFHDSPILYLAWNRTGRQTIWFPELIRRLQAAGVSHTGGCG